MSDLDLDALEATARAAIINDDPEDWPLAQAVGWDDDEANDLVSALTPGTVLALIADSRRLREAEAVIEAVEALLPKWRKSRAYNAEAFMTGGIGMIREIDYHGDVERTLATYKPTNLPNPETKD